MSTVAVGFSPVTPGNSVITGGVTAAAAGEGESALGFIDALLAMLTQGVTPGTETPPDGNTNAQPGAKTDTGNLATLGLAVEAAITGDLPAAPVQLPEDGKQLLADLVTALTAIDDAVQAGQPVDPALHKKLSEALDDLAGMLGITLPAPPAIDPVITAAAAGTVVPAEAITPDSPDIEIGKETLTAPVLPPADGDAPAADELVAEFVKAAGAITNFSNDEAAEPDAPAPVTATPVTADEEPPIDPESQLGRLIARLTEVAEKLQAKSPDVAAKIEAVVAKITARALDKEIMARLEADLHTPELDALITAQPEARPVAKAQTPSLFTAPALPMPDVVAQPPKDTPRTAKTVEPIVPSEPEVAPPKDSPVAKETQPADKPPAEPVARDRGSFAAHLTEARAERLAEQANQSQPAQATTAQVKTDLGIVTPKAVHAAYQAPVQQINVPQVAFEVVRQFSQGNSRFQIRLDPPELGRIDVRMQVDGDGNVQARMTVERAETLDLMQRDQRALERALAQAGLDSGKTSLEFSLRQNPFSRDGQGQQQGGQQSPFAQRGDRAAADEIPEITSSPTQYRGLASPSGVNLFV